MARPERRHSGWELRSACRSHAGSNYRKRHMRFRLRRIRASHRRDAGDASAESELGASRNFGNFCVLGIARRTQMNPMELGCRELSYGRHSNLIRESFGRVVGNPETEQPLFRVLCGTVCRIPRMLSLKNSRSDWRPISRLQAWSSIQFI